MFGERLKALRQSRGMTQDELCKELGIVRKTLSDYENGRRYPKSTDTVTKICGVFGVTTDFLIGSEDEAVLNAQQKYNADSAAARRIINEATALFTGGELSPEDKELVFRAISEVFWETRSK